MIEDGLANVLFYFIGIVFGMIVCYGMKKEKLK